jgi:SNF2 family DNA or RNA helicase
MRSSATPGLSVTIHGKQSQVKKDRAETAFRTDPRVRLLVGQMKACGVGLNLPEASSVVHCELPWAPGTVRQFAGRAHRMTSTGQVDEFFLIAQGTVEKDICRILEKKSKTLDRVLDGVVESDESLTVYDELCQALKERNRR